jgi:hypothetical protein
MLQFGKGRKGGIAFSSSAFDVFLPLEFRINPDP